MHVILTILKILGIILLVLLGLLLVIVFSVLFVPVRYRLISSSLWTSLFLIILAVTGLILYLPAMASKSAFFV